MVMPCPVCPHGGAAHGSTAHGDDLSAPCIRRAPPGRAPGIRCQLARDRCCDLPSLAGVAARLFSVWDVVRKGRPGLPRIPSGGLSLSRGACAPHLLLVLVCLCLCAVCCVRCAAGCCRLTPESRALSPLTSPHIASQPLTSPHSPSHRLTALAPLHTHQFSVPAC
jgi:hypothetical protein